MLTRPFEPKLVFRSPVTKDVFLRFSSSKVKSKQIYTETVLLPETTFPLRVPSKERVERDWDIYKKSRFSSLYHWQWENNQGDMFVLHDGPPYANGKAHLGHAVNKVLKDIAVRYAVLNGHRVHFQLGWDCHGLPIELKALGDKNSQESPLSLRQRARDLASHAIKLQAKSFDHWGVMNDKSFIYKTYEPAYITQQLEVFYSLYEKGLIFRDYKPVYWSPSNRTALAEAELEYNSDHQSTAVYCKFPIKKIPDSIKSASGNNPVYAVIWTTTPWTLPANQSICYMPNEEYAVVRACHTGEHFFLAAARISEMEKVLGMELSTLTTVKGHILGNMSYHHPLYPENDLPFLESKHVTLTMGTGLVHSAPNHGFEDYDVALHHGIRLKECIVDEKGCFTENAGKHLRGQHVLTSGNESVISLLGSNILYAEKFTHRYPYDWRSKLPVIIRTSQQWFVNLDDLRDKAVSCLEGVEVVPLSAKSLLKSYLEQRPHWCISRQRCWGVPLPVFYMGPCQMPVISRAIVTHLKQLIMKVGPDFWWSLTTRELLPEDILQQSGLPIDEEYCRGNDILDIWFDSGTSWLTLPEPKIADLYLEGGDQVRGWFQSSLLLSVALREKAPYKKLFLNGFTVDDKGQKMSKSLGNVVEPETITGDSQDAMVETPLGVDVLRWWVAYHASEPENICVSQQALQQSADNVVKIRSVLRFLLGVLHNFSYKTNACSLDQMLSLDRYMLHLLLHFSHQVSEFYSSMKYNLLAQKLMNFLVNDVSAYYFSLIKDRLYCEGEKEISRRSCQTALYHLLQFLCQTIAPFVPHLAEEVFLHHPDMEAAQLGVFRTGWVSCNPMWNCPSVAEVFQVVNSIRDTINKTPAGTKTQTFDAIVCCTGHTYDQLKLLQPEMKSCESGLCEALQMSQVILTMCMPASVPSDAITHHVTLRNDTGNAAEEVTITIMPATLKRCPRCRRHTSESATHPCQRCLSVLGKQWVD